MFCLLIGIGPFIVNKFTGCACLFSPREG
jgi:hypothetical protein